MFGKTSISFWLFGVPGIYHLSLTPLLSRIAVICTRAEVDLPTSRFACSERPRRRSSLQATFEAPTNPVEQLIAVLRRAPGSWFGRGLGAVLPVPSTVL